MPATKRMPTRPGDVLILQTTKSYTIHAIGVVTAEGQQDFRAAHASTHETNADAATALAKALVNADGKIFLRNMDTGFWEEIA